MSEAKFCENCGAALAAGARFCEACGHKIGETPAFREAMAKAAKGEGI